MTTKVAKGFKGFFGGWFYADDRQTTANQGAMELCDKSNCPACGAPCDRKQDHEGQCHCINCGCRWNGNEDE